MRGSIFPLAGLLGSRLLRWLEACGQCPTPSRDLGLGAWAHLRRRGRGGPPLLGSGPELDDPHLCIGTVL